MIFRLAKDYEHGWRAAVVKGVLTDPKGTGDGGEHGETVSALIRSGHLFLVFSPALVFRPSESSIWGSHSVVLHCVF